MVYVPDLKGLLLHGGNGGGNPLPITWLYQPAKQQWTDLKAQNTPRGGDHAIVYDAKTKTCLTVVDGRTWIYDVAANEWAQADDGKSKSVPGGRYHAGLACDGEQGIMVLFSGWGGEKDPRARTQTEPKWAAPKPGAFTDTWLFDTERRVWHDLGKEKDLDVDQSRPYNLCYDPSRKVVFGIATGIDLEGVHLWAFRPELP
ncbi:MAG: hypothetical protein WED34_00800 [Planctomycetales bacterium]